MDAIFKIGLFIHRNKILIHVKFRMKCFLPNLEVAIPSRKWDLFLSVFCGDISCNTFLLCVNYLRLDDWAKGEQWMWEVWEPPVRGDGSEELEGGKHFSLDGVDAFLKTPLSAKGKSRREYCCQPKKIELRFPSILRISGYYASVRFGGSHVYLRRCEVVAVIGIRGHSTLYSFALRHPWFPEITRNIGNSNLDIIYTDKFIKNKWSILHSAAREATYISGLLLHFLDSDISKKMASVDFSLASQCMDFCNTLASHQKTFTFSLTIGSTFAFSLDTRESLNPAAEAVKRKSPSPIRRNARRSRISAEKNWTPFIMHCWLHWCDPGFQRWPASLHPQGCFQLRWPSFHAATNHCPIAIGPWLANTVSSWDDTTSCTDNTTAFNKG